MAPVGEQWGFGSVFTVWSDSSAQGGGAALGGTEVPVPVPMRGGERPSQGGTSGLALCRNLRQAAARTKAGKGCCLGTGEEGGAGEAERAR